MVLENITGDLLAYQGFVPGTFQHVDQLTTEQRDNLELREEAYHTADGNLYTLRDGEIVWGITRGPQNLVLRNIDVAIRQLMGEQRTVPPDTTEPRASSKEERIDAALWEEGEGDHWLHFASGPQGHDLFLVREVGHLQSLTRVSADIVYERIEKMFPDFFTSNSPGDYFPDAEAARASLDHVDTVLIDMRGLRLGNIRDKSAGFDYFVVDPKNIKSLTSEEKRAAQRVFGPDEHNFGLNMEMFAKAGIVPYIGVLTPEYVQNTLGMNGKTVLARPSSLEPFRSDSFCFDTSICQVRAYLSLRGSVRKMYERGE